MKDRLNHCVDIFFLKLRFEQSGKWSFSKTTSVNRPLFVEFVRRKCTNEDLSFEDWIRKSWLPSFSLFTVDRVKVHSVLLIVSFNDKENEKE